MFSSNKSPYSPFFTSGLMSRDEHSTRRASDSFLSLDLASPPPPRTAPPRLRCPRDSLRSIPSPKPAPSITLPELPGATLSPPAILTPKLARKITSSTVSTRARRVNRSNALERLEGRSKPQPSLAKFSVRHNFMSLSDDDESDDADSDVDSHSARSDCSDQDQEPDFYQADNHNHKAFLSEPEDQVIPTLKTTPTPNSSPTGPKYNPRHSLGSRKPTTPNLNWFQLNSFMDLRVGDDHATSPTSAGSKPSAPSSPSSPTSPSGCAWRSFIDVGGL